MRIHWSDWRLVHYLARSLKTQTATLQPEELKMTTDEKVTLTVKAVGTDGSDQSAQLTGATMDNVDGLVKLTVDDALGLVEDAAAVGSVGAASVHVDAVDGSGKHYTADVSLTITAPLPAIDHIVVEVSNPKPK